MSLLPRHARRAERLLPWHRLWTPRGAPVDVEDGGFLAERETSRYWSKNMGLKTLDELDQVPCLLALGDPGLGKSWEIGEYATRLKVKLDAAAGTGLSAGEADALLAFDATEFDSTEALRARVFGDPVFTRWRSGSGLLYLVIDSLDEARVDRDLLSAALLDEFESLPVERLRVRIACRTAVFPRNSAMDSAAGSRRQVGPRRTNRWTTKRWTDSNR
jgi:hypothetical protein